MTLDTILVTFAGLVIVWALVRMPRLWAQDSSSQLARGLRAWRPDGWPQGVQEEDRDRPWGRGCAAASAEQPEIDLPEIGEPRPVPVRGVVRMR